MDEKHGSPGSPNGKRYNAAIFKIVMFVVEDSDEELERKHATARAPRQRPVLSSVLVLKMEFI
jgi:hypothetical protein